MNASPPSSGLFHIDHILGDYAWSTVILLTAVTFFSLLLAYKRPDGSTLPLPPGPKGMPVVGNLLDLPSRKDWEVYKNWTDMYGDVVYIEALGTKIVILGSLETANDLFTRRPSNYSDRGVGEKIMLNDLMQLGWLLNLLDYNERWKRGRRIMHRYVHSNTVHHYRPLQVQGARLLAAGLIEDPDDVATAIRRSFSTTMLKLIYGMDDDENHSHLNRAERVLDYFSIGLMPGRYLVDMLSFLRYIPAWVPGAKFQREARDCVQLNTQIRNEPVDSVKQAIARGQPPSCWVQRELEGLEEGDIEGEQLLKDVAATGYLGGADTTVSSVASCILAFVVYPEVQRRGQEEIDRVVGRERLPDFDDFDKLPYVRAIANECLRWNPVAPIGAPRRVLADDEYNGMLIPKDAIILANSWGMLHNDAVYKDPTCFRPERYLKLDTSGIYRYDESAAPDPGPAAFGFGRRMCPGRHIADQSLFAMIATILATLNVHRAKDKNGSEIVPDVRYTSGVLSHPEPFAYSIQSRSAVSKELLDVAISAYVPK